MKPFACYSDVHCCLLLLTGGCSYRWCWEQFLEHWFLSMSAAAALRDYDLARQQGVLKIGRTGLTKIFREGDWARWAVQQVQQEQGQQQQQQPGRGWGSSSSGRARGRGRGRGRQARVQPLSWDDCLMQVKVAQWAKEMAIRCYPKVVIGGMPFAAEGERRSKERGWAVLRKQPGDNSMWFAKVLGVVQQSHYSGGGQTRELVICNLHESKPAAGNQAGPSLDALGLIVFPSTPSVVDGLTVSVVPAEQLASVRISVVPHVAPNLTANTMVALIRQPMEVFLRMAEFPAPN
jgi:hypothetical protein